MSSTRTARRSFTTVKEPDPVHSAIELDTVRASIPEKRFTSGPSKRFGSGHVDSDDDREQHDQNETLPSPTVASHEALERWNLPRANLWRTFAAFWSFTLMGEESTNIRRLFVYCVYWSCIRSMLTIRCPAGMNDATYGAIIPYVGLTATTAPAILSKLTLTSWKHTMTYLILSSHLSSSVLSSATMHRPYSTTLYTFDLGREA